MTLHLSSGLEKHNTLRESRAYRVAKSIVVGKLTTAEHLKCAVTAHAAPAVRGIPGC
jgi:hypothetical protein